MIRMLFIHQQIRSFLDLGACKEYPIMARTRKPQANPANQNLPTSSNMSASPIDGASAVTPAAELAAADERKNAMKNTTPRKTTRKPEIVRNELRATLVPINVEDEIRQLAYLMSERRGFEPGHETEDWLNAEREVRQRYHQHSA